MATQKNILVPATISSQLDDSGRERIHMAPFPDTFEKTPWTPPPIVLFAVVSSPSPYLSVFLQDNLLSVDVAPTGFGRAVTFSPEGDHLAYAAGGVGVGPFVYKVSVSGLERLTTPSMIGFPSNCAYSPDGSQLVVGDSRSSLMILDRNVDSYSVAQEFLVLVSSVTHVNGLGFAPDSNRFVVTFSGGGTGIMVFDKTGGVWAQNSGATADISSGSSFGDVSFSPSGDRLAVAKGVVGISFYAVSGDDFVPISTSFPAGTGTSIAWSIDGRYLAAVIGTYNIRVVDTDDYSIAAEFSLDPNLPLGGLAFSADGSRLYVTGQSLSPPTPPNGIHVIDTATWTEVTGDLIAVNVVNSGVHPLSYLEVPL